MVFNATFNNISVISWREGVYYLKCRHFEIILFLL